MSLARAYHAGPLPPAGGEIMLDEAESRHLVRVRRVRIGDEVEVLDGKGVVAAGKLAGDDGVSARIQCEHLLRHPAPVPLMLAVGLPKGSVFEEIIRQATELGVTAIQPLLTERAEIRLADPERLAHKQSRWQAAAIEACKQSGNPWLPEIFAPVSLDKWMASFAATGSPASSSHKWLRLVASLELGAKPLSAGSLVSQSPVAITIGPEGDFTPGEYAALAAAHFLPVRLPGHILRVETACAVALAALSMTRV